jgi:hypothetical protein
VITEAGIRVSTTTRRVMRDPGNYLSCVSITVTQRLFTSEEVRLQLGSGSEEVMRIYRHKFPFKRNFKE